MKYLTKYQFACNGYQVSELGNSRISMYQEHGTYHLKHRNVLGAGQCWEVYESNEFTKAQAQFKRLVKIQNGNYELKNYDASRIDLKTLTESKV